MRDRLIELMFKRFSELVKDGDWNFNEMLVRVADHLLANGVIVPPCEVGDTVYVINVRYKTLEGEENNIPDHTIEEAVITGIKYQPASKILSTNFYIFTNKNPLVPLPLNSETETSIYGVFLSYEKAEAVLKGGA